VDGVQGRLSFSVFSENMQRKASQTTKVGSPKNPFSKMANPAVHSEEQVAETTGLEER
jgi:hypothetical protein